MTVAWADQEDGTGTTITISGLGAAATHVPYLQSFNGQLGASGTWGSFPGRTGNGTIDVVATTGRYFGYVESNDGGTITFSAMHYLLVSDGTTSVHYRSKHAVRDTIAALALDGVTATNVVVRKLPSDRGHDTDDGTYSYPAIVVSGLGIEGQNQAAGTNIRDDVDYPVMVTILARDNQDLVSNDNQYLKWREQINRAFRSQRLTGVPESMRVNIQPGPIVSPSAFWKNYYHSSMVVRCINREIRGIA